MPDPYQTLGLAPNATEDDAKKAYRKLAMQFHPDRNQGDAAAEAKFKEVASAYEAIEKGWRPGQPPPGQHGNPFGHGFGGPGGAGGPAGFPPGFEFHFQSGDPFADLFSAMNAQRQRQNNHHMAQVMISLEDAFTGKDASITVPSEKGTVTLSVKIPKGVESGTRLSIRGHGSREFKDLPPGDLHVVVLIAPHPRFERQGFDLFTSVQMDALDLLVGGEAEIIGIDGRTMKVSVPAGWRANQRLHIRDMGMPLPMHGASERGHLMVAIEPVFKVPTEEQRALLQQARDLSKAQTATN